MYPTPSSQQVYYPKPKKQRKRIDKAFESRSNENGNQWRATNTCHGWSEAAEEERKRFERKNKKAVSVSVPKVGLKKSLVVAKVDQIPRRKTEDNCRHNQEKVGFAIKYYRPPCTHAKFSHEEKQRLAEIFDTSEGRCLSDKSTLLLRGEQNAECSETYSQANTLFDQIYQEIVERRQYQIDLEEIEAGLETRDQVANEIKVRVERLKKMDPVRAALINLNCSTAMIS